MLERIRDELLKSDYGKHPEYYNGVLDMYNRIKKEIKPKLSKNKQLQPAGK